MTITATSATFAQLFQTSCALSGCRHQAQLAQLPPRECEAIVAPLARILPTPLRSQVRSACAALPLRARSTTRNHPNRSEPVKARLHSQSPAGPICRKPCRAEWKYAGQRMRGNRPHHAIMHVDNQHHRSGTIARRCVSGLAERVGIHSQSSTAPTQRSARTRSSGLARASWVRSWDQCINALHGKAAKSIHSRRHGTGFIIRCGWPKGSQARSLSAPFTLVQYPREAAARRAAKRRIAGEIAGNGPK